MQMFLNKTNLENLGSLGPQASVSIGKWLSPYSGLRLVGTGGFFTNYVVPGSVKAGKLRHVSVSGGLDYLWNITSTMSGYNPDRIFDLIGSVCVLPKRISADFLWRMITLRRSFRSLWLMKRPSAVFTVSTSV